MPSDGIRYDVSNLIKFAQRIEKDLNDASQAIPLIGEALLSAIEDTFIAEGAVPGQTKWEGLAASTIEGRRTGPDATQPPYQILTDTAVMRGSFTRRAGNDWAEAFSDNPYLPAHRGGSSLPIRDPFNIDAEELEKEATEMIFQYFRRPR